MTAQLMNRPSIQSLKHKAKMLAGKEKMALNQALNLIANDHGFTHWSLLMKHFNNVRLNDPETIWRAFYSGEMMLLSAPEGAGKLSMALNLACIALKDNTKVNYMTIHNNSDVVSERFKIILGKNDNDLMHCDNFKIINADPDVISVLERLKLIETNALVIIDYIQAIENQHRESASCDVFFRSLKEITMERGLQLLILSQATKEGHIQLLHHMGDIKQLLRHFSHYLHLNHHDHYRNDERELTLIKSTHYQRHESLLSFNKTTYLFDIEKNN